MSNNEATNEGPIFQLQRIYVKDVSFENPNAPEIFDQSGKQPKVTMDMGLANRKVADDLWEVTFKVSAETREPENDKLLFEVEVEHGALFYLKNIPDEHMAMVLAVDCPTIILPYTRQVISQLTVDGGYLPFMLEPVNFRGLFESKMQQMQNQQESDSTVQ